MIVDKIKEDLKQALKDGKSLEVSALRLLLSSIQVKEKEVNRKYPLTEDEIIGIIVSESKKRKESIKFFRDGKRDDLADKEEQELETLKKYLPQEISEKELEEIVKQAFQEVSSKDFGSIMAWVMPKVKNRSDGNRVSQKIKDFFAKIDEN